MNECCQDQIVKILEKVFEKADDTIWISETQTLFECITWEFPELDKKLNKRFPEYF